MGRTSEKSPNTLNTTNDFEKLAKPSENNPVEYFSSIKPALFKGIIGKFMGDMNMPKMAMTCQKAWI